MDSNFWDDVYKKKSEHEVSWFQDFPKCSLAFISDFNLAVDAQIIDVGGGESRLVDHLLEQSFFNISILDISAKSLEKTKKRLGKRAENINFIVSDITLFRPNKKYDLWHDRATFHFLTEKEQVERYLKTASEALSLNGYLLVSTFSKSGPDKCSGLKISQYSQEDLKALFGRYFCNTSCKEEVHVTPWGSEQAFVYCGFKKVTGASEKKD